MRWRSSFTEGRFWEFFTAHIRNPNSRLAYLTTYIDELTRALSAASVKHHVAGLRVLFDWLVID